MVSRRVPLLISCLVAIIRLVEPGSVSAQVQVATLEEMRTRLSAGDRVALVENTASGPISRSGQLLRFGDNDLDIRIEIVDSTNGTRHTANVTVLRTAIQSLERKKDSTKDGKLIGAGVGAGLFLVQFIWALSVDRNEFDEWGPSYALLGAIDVGGGMLIGGAIDGAQSKPLIKFDASTAARIRIRAAPLLSHNRRGIGLSFSF